MGLSEYLSRLFGDEEVKLEKLNEETYAYIEIDFEDVNFQGNNILLKFPGKICSKVEYSGDKQDATLKISSKRASELPLSEIKTLKSLTGFDKLFLSSSDTHGILTLIVSAGVISEVQPSISQDIKESKRSAKTASLWVTTSAQKHFLACPEGKKLEIVGFNVAISQATPTGVGGNIWLMIDDEEGSHKVIFRCVPEGDGVGDNSTSLMSMSNILFRGGLNKELELKNVSFGAGRIGAAATIFYREV